MTRITTLMPATNPMNRTKRLPKLNTADMAWTICRKLGTYLMSGLDPDGIRQTAHNAADYLLNGDTTEPAREQWPEIVNRIIGKTKSETIIREHNGEYCIIALGTMPKRYLGRHKWYVGQDATNLTTIIGVRLPVIVGARELITDETVRLAQDAAHSVDKGTADKMIRTIICENYAWLNIHQTVEIGAKTRWNVELGVELNMRWKTSTHTATVFMDKKNCDDAHRQAAADSVFARDYRHVEIDDGVDLDLFHKISREYELLKQSHKLPEISHGNAFRFRLTGRHKAIGVYSPTLHALAIDPRHPYSTFHEMLHAWDHEHGMMSLDPSFRPLIDAYGKLVDMSLFPQSRQNYVLTPTEILARAGEFYAMRRGLGGSFAPTEAWLKDSPYHQPLFAMEWLILDWFDKHDVTALTVDVTKAA